MTQMEITHSPFIYDRKPIIVLPNACAMPERGERAMDSFADADHELDAWSTRCRTKRATGGYFHPRAYEAVEYEGDSEQSEQSSSLLFARDGFPHCLRNDTASEDYGRQLPHFRGVPPPPFVVDSSDAVSDSIPGHFNLHTMPMDPCQFVQHMDLSLPFLSQKKSGMRVKMHSRKERRLSGENDFLASPNCKKAALTRTSSTGSLERISKVATAGFGGFSSGFCDSGLEGCLGGF